MMLKSISLKILHIIAWDGPWVCQVLLPFPFVVSPSPVDKASPRCWLVMISRPLAPLRCVPVLQQELGLETCFGHHLLGHAVPAAERWICTACSFMRVPEAPSQWGQTAVSGAMGLIVPPWSPFDSELSGMVTGTAPSYSGTPPLQFSCTSLPCFSPQRLEDTYSHTINYFPQAVSWLLLMMLRSFSYLLKQRSPKVGHLHSGEMTFLSWNMESIKHFKVVRLLFVGLETQYTATHHSWRDRARKTLLSSLLYSATLESCPDITLHGK